MWPYLLSSTNLRRTVNNVDSFIFKTQCIINIVWLALYYVAVIKNDIDMQPVCHAMYFITFTGTSNTDLFAGSLFTDGWGQSSTAENAQKTGTCKW